MTKWTRFSLMGLLVAVTAAGAGLAYLRACIYKRQPHAFRVYKPIDSDIPLDFFRASLVERIEELGYERCDDAEARDLASFRMVHNDCQGLPVVYRGRFSNGKAFYIHCYFSPSPPQPDKTIYSISVSFFETPYERWRTKEVNHSHARDTAFVLYDAAYSLWAEQWHAQQRRINGLPPQ